MPPAHRHIDLATPSATYRISIGPDLLATLAPRLRKLLGTSTPLPRLFLITSPEIWHLYAATVLQSFPPESPQPTILFVPPGEEHKRLPTVERLLEELAQAGADRGSILLALGGGVLGDLTGFVAAIYMRGLRYLQLPTTLLAQVDSSVGGKTGVNLAAGKNLAGSFHHPLAVLADTSTLATLPPRELRAGLQEAIKAGIIRDRALFDYLDTRRAEILGGDSDALLHVVAESVRIKAEVVSADEREGGLRMILNLGHTLGHAIEAATGYTQLLHGEAVAWGMLAAVHIARRRGSLGLADAERIREVIQAYGPLRRFAADPEQLVALTAKDKKNRGGTRSFVLPAAIGTANIVHDVTEAELLHAARAITTETQALPPA